MPIYLKIIEYVAKFIAILLVISFHEFAHAFAAVKCGDETPRLSGRLTLNPVAHINWIGLLMMFVAGFGWANPVPINPYNFKNVKKGYFWTSIAGVITNYIFAFLSLPLYYLCLLYLPSGSFISIFLSTVFYDIFVLNLCFFVFNLIPVYPLDGFRVLEVLVKTRGKVMTFLRTKGQIVLLCLLVLSLISDYVPALWFLDILGHFMNFSINILGKPITLFWNLIF